MHLLHLNLNSTLDKNGNDIPAPKSYRKKLGRPPKDPNKMPAEWCDESVGHMFRLRYTSALSERFNTKNNNDKKVAFAMLAAELSTLMQRSFTAKQIQDKFSKMKSQWSTSKPQLPHPTGNKGQAN
ncbi:hypothetical protein AC1031_019517 [Aphanomyces cochlioides]|nr:hypothetical protein AC1031_019517 [Aphanomyces cochlioides]